MKENDIFFSAHAIIRMFERNIDPSVIKDAIQNGLVINQYPDDRPYPSRLILFYKDTKPIHVVAADDNENKLTYIITVYIPDKSTWNDDFTKRRN